MARERKSDRWITPGVIIAAILVAGLVACVVAAGVTYLAARGIDPAPMLQLTAQVATSVGVVGNLVLQLAGRSTAAKTERNTGVLATVVAEATSPATPPAEPAYDDSDAPWPPPDTEQRMTVPPLPAIPRHARSTRP